MPPLAGETTWAINCSSSSGADLRNMGSASRQRREYRELVSVGDRSFDGNLGEIERAQWLGRKSVSAGKKPEASHHIANRCRARDAQLEGLTTEGFGVAPEEENLNGERGPGGCRHE
jgi:hypothetical protein